MNAFEKRAQLKDIKPGAILYEVFSITGVKAEMGRKHIVTGFPYNHRGIGLFVNGITIYNDWENHSHFSLMDRNVVGATIIISMRCSVAKQMRKHMLNKSIMINFLLMTNRKVLK
ncbi:hypothetical protein IANJMKHF_00257 [Klebsiella phage CPRSA]|nr:hypothetical protein IANJMKHF_00257 [Klebsiella phage CPRSA]